MSDTPTRTLKIIDIFAIRASARRIIVIANTTGNKAMHHDLVFEAAAILRLVDDEPSARKGNHNG